MFGVVVVFVVVLVCCLMCCCVSCFCCVDVLNVFFFGGEGISVWLCGLVGVCLCVCLCCCLLIVKLFVV